jgi:hypothetical protein
LRAIEIPKDVIWRVVIVEAGREQVRGYYRDRAVAIGSALIATRYLVDAKWRIESVEVQR